jgi:dUTP pyrophosphatase
MSSLSSQNNIKLRFVKLTENARSPTRGSTRAAGLVLYSACNTTVPARGKELILTDLQIQLPEGCYGMVAPCSAMALAHHIDIGGVVIVQDYRGNIGVIIYDNSDTPFIFRGGPQCTNYL